MKKEKKKGSWKKSIGVVIFMIVGFLGGFLGASLLDESATQDGRSPLDSVGGLLFFLVGFCVALMIQIIIHEAGHLVFGMISGYQFSSFRIMSFMWVKQEDKLKFKRFSLAGTGGQCLMAPPDMVDGRIPVTLYNLGGPLMNLIASAIFGAGYLLVPEKTMLSLFLALLALSGIALALMNGIPMHTGMVDNDGYNAFSLKKDANALRSFWLQLKVNEQISKGIRVKDMPDEWFVFPEDTEMENTVTAVTGVLCCNRLMDQCKFEEANAKMKHFLEIKSGIAGVHRGLMLCDRIYCELMAGNREEAAALMTKEQENFIKSMKQYPSVLRTNYVYALRCEEDAAKAQKYMADFEKCARSYPYPSDIEGERELMELAK